MALEQSPDRITSTRWFSDALVIAFAPVYVYTLTLTYLLAFARVFAIPPYFVNVSWTAAFAVGMTLLALFEVAFVVAYIIACFWIEGSPSRWAIRLAPLLMIVFAVTYSAWERWYRWWVIAIVPAISLAIGLILFWLKPLQRELDELHRTTTDRRRYVFLIVSIVCWLSMGYVVVGSLGVARALEEVNFYVIPTNPERVVLGIYGDTVVAATFDHATKEVKRDFVIIRVSEQPPLNLRQERIGPLHVQEGFNWLAFP
jgi:hypothetical protein